MENAKTRSDIDEKYKWRLDHIYQTNELWRSDYDYTLEHLKDLSEYRGKLSEPDKLLGCLKLIDELSGKIEKIYVYAHMRSDENTNDSYYQGLSDMAESIASKCEAEIAFFEPELMNLDEKYINDFLSGSDECGLYRQFLDDKLRLREHTLSPEIEELLAQVSEIANGPSKIFSVLENADMKFGEVTNDEGEKVELTHGRYGSLIRSANRDVRREAYQKYYSGFIKQKNTLAATYNSSVKGDVFFARTKKFPSSMEAALAYNAIPVEVYNNLLATVKENLGLMNRYNKLRKKILGLSELHRYDLYTPIALGADTHVAYEDACQTVLKALAPLGREYCKVVERSFSEGWIDVYESEGKRNGGYQWGEYDTHPFILLNYDNKLNDMFTLAHEMGHAMHSYLTKANQPRVYGGYKIFVAEVASTVNEALLVDYLLKTTPAGVQKQLIINHFLEQFNGTLYRQVMFADFEKQAHETVERGEPLTLDTLCKIYGDLDAAFNGPVVDKDPESDIGWSRIPHFYNAFYVYQYATGFSAAMALSDRILNGGDKEREEYLSFLKSGSSDYPVNLLKKAGVDMSSPEPVKAALAVFDKLLTEFEAGL